MKKIILLLAVVISFQTIESQKKTCESPQEDLFDDLNTITKCSVNKTKDKKNRQISVKVSASKRRFLIKRNAKKDKVEKLNGLKSNSISNPALRLKNKIASISKTMSSAEIKKAEKFITVNRIPNFVECKSTTADEESDCFNTEMIKHIEKYFNYPDEAIVKKIEGQVWVRFIIDRNGNVANIKALGPKNGKLLEEEAIRVASHLPKFIPGVKNGDKVAVKYGFPINFSLNE